jgi:hypothetical protein
MRERKAFMTREDILSQLPQNATPHEKWIAIEELLGIRRDYDFDGDHPKACAWIPETKVLVIPPDTLLWLGSEEPKAAAVASYRHALARYVITGGKSITWDDLIWEDIGSFMEKKERGIQILAGQALKKLDEPYRSRLAAFLLSTRR